MQGIIIGFWWRLCEVSTLESSCYLYAPMRRGYSLGGQMETFECMGQTERFVMKQATCGGDGEGGIGICCGSV